MNSLPNATASLAHAKRGRPQQFEAVDVVTVGETMGLIRETATGRLDPQFVSGFGGAESNVMTQLSRLGHRARWISALGDDRFGSHIRQGLSAEGVQVVCGDNHGKNTGLMVKTYAGDQDPAVTYYRKESAASGLGFVDIPSEAIATAGLIHLTGIYPALSPASLKTTMQVLEAARESSLQISFDVNYRPALWDRAHARAVLPLLARYANIIFGSRDELDLLDKGASNPDDLELLTTLSAKERLVVLKRGPHGAAALAEGSFFECGAWPATVVDTVGAGDAFVGGYLSQYLEGATTDDCLSVATYCGAMACEKRGDWEGQPLRSDLIANGLIPPSRTEVMK